MKRKLLSLVLCASLCVAMTGSPLGNILPTSAYRTADASTAQGINVAYHTQQEIRSYVAENGATLTDALIFASEPVTTAPYSLGQLSQTTLDSALAMINQTRYIAGLSYDVTLDDSYTERTQAAALANYVNDQLSHYPAQPDGMSDEMYQLARLGAGSSNISWASWPNRSLGDNIVNGWLKDSNASNIQTLGHRRWILNPSMGKTGFGAVSGSNGTYSAMYSFDRSNTSATEKGVVWPAQNMPIEYFNTDFPWSVSMGSTVTASDIQVTLTRESDGKTWNFSNTSADGDFYVNNDSYGQSGCIIFRPDLSTITRYADGDTFQVSITGLSEGTVSYTVQFFALEETVATSQPTPTAKPSVDPSASPDVSSSAEPSIDPSASPDINPTAEPSINPSAKPSVTLSASPDVNPTAVPIVTSSAEPDINTTAKPSVTLSASPTPKATATRQPDQTNRPTPSVQPTRSPSPSSQAAGGIINTKNADYLITKSGKNPTVSYLGLQTPSASVTIPKTVTKNGVRYRVTSINSFAFAGQSTLKKVVISKNITKIGSFAWFGCRNLRKITIKTTKLKKGSVGKKAFQGIHQKAVITVPKKKKTAYQRILRTRGVKKTMKIRS